MPVQRSSFGFITIPTQGVILAFGGGSTMPAYNDTFMYDPLHDVWTNSSSSLIDGQGRNRAGNTILTCGNSGSQHDEWVITTGGFSLDPFFSPMSSTECYSSKLGQWVQTSTPEHP